MPSRVWSGFLDLSAIHPAAKALSIWKDGSNDRPSAQWKVEGHGRIAGCCVGLRHRRKRQHRAVLLMAFAPSQKQ
jgi:hypothetical protein